MIRTEQELLDKIDEISENSEGDWDSDGGEHAQTVVKTLMWVLGKESELT